MNLKGFFSWIVLLIGGLIGALLPTSFSVAQNYEPTWGNMWNAAFSFKMPDYSVYLYAVTEPNTYTIHFDGNWGVWNMWDLDMVYDQWKQLLPNTFTRDWSTFKWWSESPTWTVKYSDRENVRNLTTEHLWEVTLYAQRDGEVSYTVLYYLENVGWTWWDLVDTETMQGLAWTGIILTWKTYTWFTLQTGEVVIVPGWIVPYNYKRNSYELTIIDRGSVSITWVKYWADIPLPADPQWTWNEFLWWENLPWDKKMPANDLVITSTWSYGQHKITFDTDGWTEVEPFIGEYWDPVVVPPKPTKPWYEFVRWDPALPATILYDDIVVKAIWRPISNNNWKWWSGWWSKKWWSTPSEPTWWESHQAAGDQEPEWNKAGDQRADLEVFFAYMWAHDMWIIETSWQESDPDGYVTRWAMAEMVVKFSENILDRKTPEIIPAKCAWWDAESEWRTPERKVYAEKSCALWLMGIRMVDFMPNKILDRAEFGTILSRLLWWDKYDVVDATKTKLYYTRHLDALSRNHIMAEIANPEARKELRKWAWLMLMRSRLQNIEEK